MTAQADGKTLEHVMREPIPTSVRSPEELLDLACAITRWPMPYAALSHVLTNVSEVWTAQLDAPKPTVQEWLEEQCRQDVTPLTACLLKHYPDEFERDEDEGTLAVAMRLLEGFAAAKVPTPWGPVREEWTVPETVENAVGMLHACGFDMEIRHYANERREHAVVLRRHFDGVCQCFGWVSADVLSALQDACRWVHEREEADAS